MKTLRHYIDLVENFESHLDFDDVESKAKEIVQLARRGVSDEDIADQLGLDPIEVQQWLDKNYDYLTHAGDIPFDDEK